MERRQLSWTEIQIDRLVGPTHHFGGLGVGNLASQHHAGRAADPAAAALQGLEKMRLVAESGVEQFILPPQLRPDLTFLRSMGFCGDDQSALDQAREKSPDILSAAMSCSAMWMANAATATILDDAPIITIANLSSSLHRSIEPLTTLSDLRSLMPPDVMILGPLSGGKPMRDEGAANHMRLFGDDPARSLEVFVYGDQDPSPRTFTARQTRASCETISRLHRLSDDRVCLVKQNPDAIDAGAFHNDVVAMSHCGSLIHHQDAFYDSDDSMNRLEQQFSRQADCQLTRIEVPRKILSMKDAISTYLFNSQIVLPTRSAAPPILICPAQVQVHPTAKTLVNQWMTDGFFSRIEFVELGQSMSGGGGPACLRLRVPMPLAKIRQMNGKCRWRPSLHESISQIIRDEYPKSITLDDLTSIGLMHHAMNIRNRIANLLGVK